MWILLLLVCMVKHHEWKHISGDGYCLRCGSTRRTRYPFPHLLRASITNRRWIGSRELNEILRGTDGERS